MDDILGFLAHLLWSLIAWILLIPVIWLLATPFILIGSFFVKGPYSENVSAGYRNVTTFWGEWGVFMVDW